jgi:hypothetical protein
MRLTPVVALLLVAAALAGSASAVGLFVERLHNVNVDRCPYCQRLIRPGDIHESAERVLSTEFGGHLDEKGLHPTSDEKGQERTLKVFVYRFEERRGGNFAVERPASVGFHTHVYDGETLTRVFVFDETQRPLSENVFRFGSFVKRGARWVTAAELAREGVEKAVDAVAEDAGARAGKTP